MRRPAPDFGRLALATLLALTFSGLVLAGTPSSAQHQRSSKLDLGSVQTFLDGTQKLLTDPSATVADLDARRAALQDLSAQIKERLSAAERRLNEVKALEAALGPAPKEGAAKEPPRAAERRAALRKSVAEAAARMKVLNLADRESTTLLSRLDERRNALIARRLLREGPSIWSWQTWRGAARDVRRIRKDLVADVFEWWAGVRRVFGNQAVRVTLTALLIALLAGLALYIRGWILDRWGRRHEAPPSTARDVTTATLAVAVAGGMLPAAIVLGVYLYFRTQGLAGGDFRSILQGAAWAAGLYILFWAFSRAVFAPIVVRWRPLPLTDSQARPLDRMVKLLGIVLSVGLFASIASRPHFVTREIMAIWSLVIAGPAAILMLVIARRRYWTITSAGADESPMPESETRGEAGANAPPMLRGARAVLTIGALAVLVSLGLDLHRLAEFVLIGSLATAGILIAVRLLRRFVFDAVNLVLRDDAQTRATKTGGPEKSAPRLGQFWFSLLTDIALAIGAGFLLMLVWSVDIDSLGRLMSNLWSGMKIGNYTISLGDILFGIVIFVVLVALVRSAQRAFDDRIRTGTRLDTGVRNALRAGLGYAGFVVAAAIAITVAGFDLSNLAIIAGALSVGIGFGLQAIVNNFVSGLILLVERPIKEGDWIVAGEYQGVVRKIGIRATEIRTFQNASVIIPNAKLISDPVVNWLFQDRSGRGEMKVGVAYGSDTAKVRDILLETAAAHPKVRKNPPPNVIFQDFGDSALLFELRFYLSDMYNVITVPSEIRFEVDRKFREAGVEIPFPQRDIHVKRSKPAPPGPRRTEDEENA